MAHPWLSYSWLAHHGWILSTMCWLALSTTCALPLFHAIVSQMGSEEITRKLQKRMSTWTGTQLRYLRRLVRSQLYYMLATSLGCVLLIESSTSVYAMLHHWSALHEIAFAIAAGHWVVSLLEDASTPASFRLMPASERREVGADAFLFCLYLAHHIGAIFVYGFCLHTKQLGGVGVFGLIFEAPVALANVLEIMRETVGTRVTPRHQLCCLWSFVATLVLPCRFGGVAIYAFSLFQWQEELAGLTPGARMVYHGGAVAFTCFSCGWLGQLALQADADLGASARVSEARRSELPLCGSGPASAGTATRAAADGGLGDKGAAGSGEQPARRLPLVSEADLPALQARVEAYGAVLLAINGTVFNVGAPLPERADGSFTDSLPGRRGFLSEHPGGEEVLRRHAGQECSASFAAVGHSAVAHAAMAPLAVGILRSPMDVYSAMFQRMTERAAWKDAFSRGSLSQPYKYGFREYGAFKADGPGLAHAIHVEVVLLVAYVAALCSWRTSLNGSSASVTHILLIRQLATLLGVLASCHLLYGCSCARTACAQWWPLARHGGAVLLSHLVSTAALLSPTHPLRLLLAGHLLLPTLSTAQAGALATSRGLVALGMALTGVAVMPRTDAAQWQWPSALTLAASTHLLGHSGGSAVQNPATLRTGVAVTLACAICVRDVAKPLGDGEPHELRPWAPLFASGTRWGPSTVGEMVWVVAALLGCESAFSWQRVVRSSSSTFATHARTLAMLVIGAVAGHVAGELPLDVIAWLFGLTLLYMGRLYACALPPMRERGLPEDEQQTHAWLYEAAWLADTYRALLAGPVFRLGRLCVSIANMLAPHPVVYYCHPEATLDYDGAPMGIAYYVGPSPLQQPKPTTFVCNVGALARGHDALAIAEGTYEMTRTLGDADGFVGQYLANIIVRKPLPASPLRAAASWLCSTHIEYKQLNLTAWTSGRAAHDWYVGSKAHGDIVRAHRTGMLTSFSSMLATLAPARPTRYDARCKDCHLVNPRYPESRVCPHCGSPDQQVPLF